MKYTKYFVLAGGVIVVLAAATWFLRNSLIERLSNPLLVEYGLTLTDVSLDALSSSNASISYLELVHNKGTTITIEDLDLPVGNSARRVKHYSAGKITIFSATRDEDEPFELAQLIDQFLGLPERIGEIEVDVGALQVPPYPEVRDLRLALLKSAQELGATVGTLSMSATFTPSDDGSYAVVFSLPQAAPEAPTPALSAKLLHSAQGIDLDGLGSLDLPAWQTLTRFAGILPQAIDIQSGMADMGFKLNIPYDTRQSPSVVVQLAPVPPLQFIYTDDSGTPISINVVSGSPVEATATFPEVDWALRQQKISLVVSYDDWKDIPLRISDLSCRAGPLCTLKSSITLKSRRLPIAKVGQLAWSSAETVTFLDNGLRIDVEAGGTIEAGDLLVSARGVKRFAARLTSTATLDLMDSGWRFAADSVDADFDAMDVADGIALSMPVYVEKLVASDIDRIFAAGAGLFVPRSAATFASGIARLPGFKGTVTRQNERVAAALETQGLRQDGTVVVQHNLATGSGKVDLTNAGLSFATQSLSKRFAPWEHDWDIAAGMLYLDANASWAQVKSALHLTGQASLRAEDLAGHYTETAFVKLATRLQAAYDSASGLSVQPATLTVGLLETGVAIENISASYVLDPTELAVDVSDLHMSAFGGTIHAVPFSFRTAANTNTVIMNAEAIRLDRLLTLGEFSAVQVSGTVAAELPISIEGTAVTISHGRLVGEPPGGVIRYSPGGAAVATDNSSMGFVMRALSNFEYKTLTSDIEYNAAGDLKLQLQLTGKSPSVDEKRPVVLNLGVENNVPQMLKSLRAARSVEEILEKRLQK